MYNGADFQVSKRREVCSEVISTAAATKVTEELFPLCFQALPLHK